jgi:D-alanine-D-alanine ligase
MGSMMTVLLVGDVVDAPIDATGWSPFDEDQPSLAEMADLRRWFEQAEYRVEARSVRDFLTSPPKERDDLLVFPLWRGGQSRTRTALVPAVCEGIGLRYVGGDAFVQSVCQDKSLSKACARAAGFEVPQEWPLRDLSALEAFHPSRRMRPPFVVKPLFSAASLGVSERSLCWDDNSARQAAKELFDTGLGPAICEEFISGDEISLCLLEEGGTIIERCVVAYRDSYGRCPFYDRLFTFADKARQEPPWTLALCPVLVDERIWSVASELIRFLGKVDYIRIDGRLQGNRFVLIELTPDIHLSLQSAFLGGFSAAGNPPATILRRLTSASLNNQRSSAKLYTGKTSWRPNGAKET